MNRLIIALLGSVLYSGASMAQKQTYFTNPVIHGDVADPSILRIDDTYYATGTSSEWAPYYPVFTSKDLVNWKQTGHVFEQQPEWTKSSFWAPEWYYHNGKVYVYYTARKKSNNTSYTDRLSNSERKRSMLLSSKTRVIYTSAGKPTDWTTGRSNFSPAS